MKNLFTRLLLIVGVCFSTHLSLAQGSTTAALSGVVTDNTGTGLAGATVVAVHTPSNTQYAASTDGNGRFGIQNMRVGGPYTITATYIGYQEQRKENINLLLGQSTRLEFALATSAVGLGEVEVVSNRNSIINSERTGAATTISREQITTLPTISRGFQDFVRLTPQVDVKGGSISIAGINNRFNQITIDGAVSNDVFGLAGTGTNGGSTGTSPISLDAIEQFNVQIAPFDVRLGGFGGGGISAVTRSGTNEVQGSAYYYLRNEKTTGKTPGGLLSEGQERTRYGEFSDKQYGVRIGGPIVKDKLFFFLNAEQTDRVTPLSFAPGQNGSEITVAELNRIVTKLATYGYDPGSFMDQEEINKSNKLFGRLDWNISDKHKLTARYSYTYGEATQLSRGVRSLTFANGAILRKSTTNSGAFELNSRFSNNLSNNLVVGVTTVREPRTSAGAPFPRVSIQLDVNRTVNLGSEAFSTINLLEQDVLTLTDNLTLFKGAHTFTFGTHNEFYNMYNAFIGDAYGTYQFRVSPATNINPATNAAYTGLENFERGLANTLNYQYSKTDDPRVGAKFKALQVGLYAQDDFQATENLKIVGGIRLDVPVYLDEPMENQDFNNSVIAKQYNVSTNRMPKPALLWSPRVGFNWDVKGDRATQLRGGTGIFTSRLPFVWAAGAFTQSGVLLDRNQIGSTSTAPTIVFNPDPFSQPKRATASGPGGNITVLEEDFKMPQIARTNIAIDQQLPWGFIGTAEFLYSKNLNSIRFTNINLKQPTGTLTGADNRLVYGTPVGSNRILPQYTEVIYVTNEDAGYAWTATAQLQKSFESGFYGSIAYSFTESKDLFAGTSSQNQSNFYRVPTVNGSNNVQLGFSPFNVGSRIVGAVSYRKEYLGFLATTVSMFYNGQSGTPFSYVVNGDLTRSVTSGSASDFYSLIYVPRDRSEIQFVQNGQLTPDQQWTAFNDFIESQEHLRDRRGQYAQRNGARTPFTHQFDVKLVQDLFVNVGGKRNTLQLSLDVLNVGNLLNKDWGARYFDSYFDNRFQTIQLDSFDATNTPRYRFTPIKDNKPFNQSDDPLNGSRWVGQVGLRYIFN